MGADFWVQFVVAVITILASLLSVLALPGRRLKLICGSAFVALGVLWVFLLRIQIADAQKTGSELQSTLRKISDLQAKLNTSQDQLGDAQRINNRLQQQLMQATATVGRLSNESLNTATGGDSFCVVSLIPPLNQTGRALLVLVHAGKYPLYALNVKLVDAKLAAAAMQNRGPKGEMPDTSTQLNVGLLDVEGAVSVDTPSLEGDAARRFTFFFQARNGHWTEVLVIRRLDERWVQAIKVYKSEYREKDPRPHVHDLYTRIDPDYPRQDGKVDWNIGYVPASVH